MKWSFKAMSIGLRGQESRGRRHAAAAFGSKEDFDSSLLDFFLLFLLCVLRLDDHFAKRMNILKMADNSDFGRP